MERLISVDPAHGGAEGSGTTGLPPFDPADLARHAADCHWRLMGDHGETAGRCSLWWRNTPSLPGHRLGLIGHYAAIDGVAARRLLQHGCAELAARGCTLAVGPMDGSTWRRYRLIVERGSEPVFFLEPDNPDDWPEHFRDSGFAPLAHYSSAINIDLSRFDPRLPEIAERLAAQGVRLRAFDPGAFEDELRGIYAVSGFGFRNNFLYAPLAEAEFIAQYRALRPHVRADLVFIAEHRGEPIGFIFAIPDLLQARRGQPIDTVIIKTVAVLPEHAGAGLGGLLVARVQEIARDLGYTRVIHALMHEVSHSGKISRHYARTMRRYALFARTLRP